MNYCKVLIAGNLVRDVEMRFTPKGSAVADITIAVNRTFTINGEKRETVLFQDITVFGKQAETLAQYCKKGSNLFVEGRLESQEWEDKKTQTKRQKTVVILEQFQFCGGKSDSKASAPISAPASNVAAAEDSDDPDSVPF